MENTLIKEDVLKEIKKFREIFKDTNTDDILSGDWFIKLLKMVLNDTNNNLGAEYFFSKYVGLNNEQIALKMTETYSNYTAVAGSLSALVVTAAEFKLIKNRDPRNLITLILPVIGEFTYITYMQLKLVNNISIICDAKLDKDDPEDIMVIFWYALGIKVWENVANMALRANTRGAEYLGRKFLRIGIRKAMQEYVKKFGGQKLARKLTEKAMLEQFVPGVNMGIAFLANRSITSNLGKLAIKRFSTRGQIIGIIDQLSNYDRYYQLITIPLIYHVALSNDKLIKAGDIIEMQSNVGKRLQINNEEEEIIDRMLKQDIGEFCGILSTIEEKKVKKLLSDIAAYSNLLNKNKSEEIFKKIHDTLVENC